MNKYIRDYVSIYILYIRKLRCQLGYPGPGQRRPYGNSPRTPKGQPNTGYNMGPRCTAMNQDGPAHHRPRREPSWASWAPTIRGQLI